jgi:hypothetical protein
MELSSTPKAMFAKTSIVSLKNMSCMSTVLLLGFCEATSEAIREAIHS